MAQGAAAAVTTQPATPPSILRLAVSAELNGRVATPLCGDDVPPPPLMTLASDLAGESDALVLDAGDFVGSSAMGHFAATHDVAALATAAAAMGIRAMAIGHRDLAMAREQFLSVAAAMRARNIPYVLTNLSCDAAANALCDAVIDSADAPLVLDTPQGRVAYLAVLGPSAIRFVARNRSAGITLQPVAEAIGRGVAAARAAGARWVVVAHDPDGPDVEDTALAVARDLPSEARPDLMLVNGASDFIASMEAARSGIPVVMTRAGRGVAIELGAPRLAREARQGTVPAEVVALSTSTHDWLCSTQNTPLRGGRLTAPLDRDAFTEFFLNVLRDETETEVAIINRGAIQGREVFPLQGALTPLHLATVLPFDDRIYVGRIRGSVLSDLARSSRADRFVLRGITTDGGVKINGRPLEPTTMYRVVTTGFVYDGGEGGIGATDGVELEVYGTQGPREFFSNWLDQPHEGDITQIPVDPARRTRWTFNASIDLGFQLVNSANPAGGPMGGTVVPYNNPQLSRTDTMALRGDARFFANAHNPHWEWLNDARARYGRASVGGGDFNENLDIIELNSNFRYRGFSATPRWYLPAPDMKLLVETEFDRIPRTATVPDASNPHHLRVQPTLGLAFSLNTFFSWRLGAGLEWRELLTGDDPTYVFVGEVKLTPYSLFSLRGRDVTWQVEVKAQVNQAFSDAQPGPLARDFLLTGTTRLAVPVFQSLNFTISYDTFMRLARGNELGISHDLTFGLAWTWARAIQTFR
jgi:2',3'-cyclic-nucleotide 2'-phosphodiesterase (5'-nucleotidase family)